MSFTPNELETSASKYAAEAIQFDSQGSNGLAIQAYQRAVEVLTRLIQLYPDYKLNKIYMQRASTYQNRIKTLQMSDDDRSRIFKKATDVSKKGFMFHCRISPLIRIYFVNILNFFKKWKNH